MVKGGKSGLSKETFLATKQTTKGLFDIAKFLLEKKEFNFVMLGRLQSDPIERRFGWYRQLSGGNYFVSIRQILEAEKSIRLKSLVTFSGFSMDSLKEVFSESARMEEEEVSGLSASLLIIMDKDSISLDDSDFSSQNILFYIGGYAARGLVKMSKCQSCIRLLRQEKEVPPVQFEEEENSPSFQEMKQAFTRKLDKGGLVFPSEEVYLTCLASWNFYSEITNCPPAKNFLFEHTNARDIFVQSLISLCESLHGLLVLSCENGHSFKRPFQEVARKMFNIFTKNYCAEVNSVVHEQKKRKAGQDQRKVKKLQSSSQ